MDKRGSADKFVKYDGEKIVKANHPLREIEGTVNFKAITLDSKEILEKLGRKGYREGGYSVWMELKTLKIGKVGEKREVFRG